MHDWLLPYLPAVWALGAMAALMLLQILVVDAASIRAKHPPGSPVAPDHGSFLFRATRAHGNTNEGVAAFILLALFGIFSGAAPAWLNVMAWVYAGARLAYTLCYYADLRSARSLVFGVGLAGQLGMLAVGIAAWF